MLKINDVLAPENQVATNLYIAKLNEILAFKDGAIAKKKNAKEETITLEDTIRELNNQFAIETVEETVSQIVSDRKAAILSLEDCKSVIKMNYLGELSKRLNDQDLYKCRIAAENELHGFVKKIQDLCVVNNLIYENEKAVILEHPFYKTEDIKAQISNIKGL